MKKTGFRIDEEIIQSTTNCEFNFSCLSVDKPCICEVVCSIGCGLLEINPKICNDCKYRMSFGYTYFCHCPTRVEIYNRYTI